MATTTGEIHAKDVVEVEARAVGSGRRLGEVIEVLGEPGHEHYRVRWEDGTETILYPSGGAMIKAKREE